MTYGVQLSVWILSETHQSMIQFTLRQEEELSDNIAHTRERGVLGDSAVVVLSRLSGIKLRLLIIK